MNCEFNINSLYVQCCIYQWNTMYSKFEYPSRRALSRVVESSFKSTSVQTSKLTTFLNLTTFCVRAQDWICESEQIIIHRKIYQCLSDSLETEWFLRFLGFRTKNWSVFVIRFRRNWTIFTIFRVPDLKRWKLNPYDPYHFVVRLSI